MSAKQLNPAYDGMTDQQVKRFKYWEFRTMAMCIFGYALFYFVRKNLSIAMPYLNEEMGISKSDLGLFLTLHGLIYGLSKFFNGIWGDRSNARYFLVTGLVFCGICNLLFGFSSSVLALGIFLSVWANDSFAYLVGSKFGKHKLAPRTSPKKSWEGFIAGLVGSAAFWCLMTLIPGVTMSIPQAMAFGLISGLMGVLGDLAESRIKRNSGFKDSGTIMPGHGGLLDRCDSLFLVAVTSAILLLGFGCIPFPVPLI